MPNVSWTDPGTSGDWSSATNWTGLVGESYPGQFAATGDIVTIGATQQRVHRHLQCPECDH